MGVKVVDIINLSSSAHTLLRNRVRMMRSAGVDNRIICINGRYVAALREEGIPVETVHIPRGYNVVKFLVSFFEIASYLRREKVDVVHTHCPIPGFIGRLAAWVARVPAIIHTVHGFYFHELNTSLGRMFHVFLERFVGLLTDALLSQNRAEMEDVRKYRIVPPNHLHYIGNGIDLERFRPGSTLPPTNGRATITCVARMEPVKNHRMLFDAVRLLKKGGERPRVWLVGDGDLRKEYEHHCKKMNIDDLVHFLGYRDDIPELLAHTDIAVLTSIAEGIPRAVLEPMAMGVPVVATKVIGSSEVVREGETGFLVELGDTETLAARLSDLIRDPALRLKMGTRAREVAVKEFDESMIVESLKAIYVRTLEEKGIEVSLSRPSVAGR